MGFLFFKLFVILFVAVLYKTSLLTSAISPEERFTNWFNKYTFDPPPLARANTTLGNCSTCPFVYFPICADDNITYLNECKLACTNKDRTKKSRFVRTGPCKIFPEYRRTMKMVFLNHTIGNHTIYID